MMDVRVMGVPVCERCVGVRVGMRFAGRVLWRVRMPVVLVVGV